MLKGTDFVILSTDEVKLVMRGITDDRVVPGRSTYEKLAKIADGDRTCLALYDEKNWT